MLDYPFKIEYDKTIDKNLKKYFTDAYEKNHQFFKIHLDSFNIKIWYSRIKFNDKFDFPKNSKYQANSGMTSKEYMNVMSPSVLKDEMKNPSFSNGFFKTLLIHEMCHRFLFKKWNKILYPVWLHEGLCCYVAKQEKYLVKDLNWLSISQMHNYENWIKKNNYWQSFLMTKNIIEEYGIDKLNDLFSILSTVENEKNFEKKFKKIYGFTPKKIELK